MFIFDKFLKRMYLNRVFLICFILFSSSVFSQKGTIKQAIKPKISFFGVTNVPSVQVRVKTRVVRFENGVIKSDKWLSTKQTYSSIDGEFNFQLTATTDPQYDLINYAIEFSKSGYATKRLLFNTYVPLEDYNKKPFEEYNFDLDVRMAEKSDSTYSGKVAWSIKERAFLVTPLVDLSEIPESLLPSDKTVSVSSSGADTLSIQEDENESKTNNDKKRSISGTFLINENNAFLENAKINLITKGGVVIRTTTTNALGAFTFTNVPDGVDYTIAVVSLPPKITIKKMVLTNKNGHKVLEDTPDKGFSYEFLASDTNMLSLLSVNNDDLMANIKGKLMADKDNKSPLANVSITIKSRAGDVVQSTKTDMYGNFQFMNIPADKNYSLLLNENDGALKSKEVFLTDAGGNSLKRLKTKDGVFFHFDFLPPDQNDITQIYFDDPWLKVLDSKTAKKQNEVIIIENLYYDFGKWNILPEARLVLDKAIVVLKKSTLISMDLLSHTDSRGTDQYNNDLSNKRALEAVRYIVSKGIEKNRITGKGMGEQYLINRCKDGAQCTEEEHAQNRRTEFKINYSVKAK